MEGRRAGGTGRRAVERWDCWCPSEREEIMTWTGGLSVKSKVRPLGAKVLKCNFVFKIKLLKPRAEYSCTSLCFFVSYK